ncbi:MAG: glycosyltransferase family 4 protein [Promethearchaeota archaeon]
MFITHEENYFVDDTPSFYRMYTNLMYFHNHEDFNVIVLQNDRERKREKSSLKKSIKVYHYRDVRLFRIRFVQFLDFNPFFISKVLKILKKHQIDLIHVDFCFGINVLKILTKIPICYNSYNVEAIYYEIIGKNYYKIPIFLRKFFAKYIYYVEKFAIKHAKIMNAFSYDDVRDFIHIYNIPKRKIFVNRMGYKEDIFNNPLVKENARQKLNVEINKFIVVFHGNYYTSVSNQKAVKIIRDQISSQIEDKEILFLIAGKMPPLRNKKNLRFMGFVKDLKTFLYSADIAIVPIFQGSGIRTKIIDYLSAKIPIITTKQGLKGLSFLNNVHGFIVSDLNPIEDMIKKILELKNNSKKIDEFKENIENLLALHYNWDEIHKVLEKKYKEIIENG